MNKILIIGLGSFGTSLLENLVNEGNDVIIVDKDKEKLDNYKNIATGVYGLDVKNEDWIQEISELKEIDYAICCIAEDMEASLLTVLSLKERGITTVFARAKNSQHEKILKAIGADETIFIEREAGEKLAQKLSKGHVYNYIPLSENHKIVDVLVNENLTGLNIKELKLRERYGINVIAIKKKVEYIDPETMENKFKEIVKKEVPDANSVFELNDILVVVGKNEDVDRFIEDVEKNNIKL